MARDNGQGIFVMSAINDISRLKTIEEAKVAAHALVDAATASPENKAKANSMVMRSRSIRELVLGMGNFTLSHMGMKSIR